MNRTAVLSPNGKYRYRLEREWDSSLPKLGWIMLNPSTADADVDDPTIRRCISFAKRWGFGGIVVCNLFAYRATDPSELETAEHPVGEHNLSGLIKMITDFENVKEIICAWGTWSGQQVSRRQIEGYVLSQAYVRGRSLWCLTLTKKGHPGHPLYIPAKTDPVPFGRHLVDRAWPY